MKSVIDIETLSIIDVDDSFIECTVCGQYKQPESYRNADQEMQSRTNCRECYNLPTEEFRDKKSEIIELKKSNAYTNKVRQLREQQRIKNNSISVEEMIASLEKLPAGSRLVVTQEGYYAEGKVAYIFSPSQYEFIDGVQYYSIGESIQNY